MMDCRLRVPGLVRALRTSRFNTLPRGFAPAGATAKAGRDTVAKRGNWHCGQDKEKFLGAWPCTVPTLFEDFVPGRAVRVMLVGRGARQKAWQIHLAGDDWKKSIHPDSAEFMPADPDLLEDARQLQERFSLDLIGVDYMIADDGRKHLLEVNHIPNVTRFAEIRAAFLDYVVEWLQSAATSSSDAEPTGKCV